MGASGRPTQLVLMRTRVVTQWTLKVAKLRGRGGLVWPSWSRNVYHTYNVYHVCHVLVCLPCVPCESESCHAMNAKSLTIAESWSSQSQSCCVQTCQSLVLVNGTGTGPGKWPWLMALVESKNKIVRHRHRIEHMWRLMLFFSAAAYIQHVVTHSLTM